MTRARPADVLPPRRRRRATVAVLLGAAACATAGPIPLGPTTSQRFFVAGYHPYWAGDAWTAYPSGVLDELYFFELEADGEGGLLDPHGWPSEWSAMTSRMLDIGVRVTPTVSMHDPAAFERLFSNDAAIARLVNRVADVLITTPGLAGIHLDFEVFQPVDLTARDGFTAFVARLGHRMRALSPELSLSVFVLAFDDDDAYNERALAELADYVVVQGYDYHSLASERAGPVGATAGWGRLNWESVVDRFLDLGVPPRKIVMAVPLYGYEWPVVDDTPGSDTRGEGVAVPYDAPTDVLPELPRAKARVAEHGGVRDGASGATYYVFEDGSGWIQGWFDDPQSLARKYRVVRERGLGGVALFPVAYADRQIWDGLRSAFSAPPF